MEGQWEMQCICEEDNPPLCDMKAMPLGLSSLSFALVILMLQMGFFSSAPPPFVADSALSIYKAAAKLQLLYLA